MNRERNRVIVRCQVGQTIDDQLTTIHNQARMQADLSPAAGETIGQRLKRLRLDRGLSQRELAAPGVSYAYISRIEAGTRQPSVKALRRLAANLGVSADYLETGSKIDPSADREIRLSDLELAVRLGEWDNVEEPLEAAIAEAVADGDTASALRARVALATLAGERREHSRAIELLEAALQDEPFAPAERYDIYHNLGRMYTEAGRPEAAVELFERCVSAVEASGDASLAARYATQLSYALSDIGELARAEAVVRHALESVKETEDPYMRVRLYWSIARLAHTEGREAVALTNVRKAIALLQATDDTFHLARAHILAAYITLSRDDADSAEQHLNQAEQLLGGAPAAQDLFEIVTQRARVAVLRKQADVAVELAKRAVELAGDDAPVDRGIALSALGEGLALRDDFDAANEAFEEAVSLLEMQGRWRHAASACTSWGRALRKSGSEQRAMDVLERAAELGMRAAPASTQTAR
jgi:transcriptional regulator with XRE-family HTH domain